MKKINIFSGLLMIIIVMCLVPNAIFAKKPIVLRWAQYVPAMPDQGGGVFDKFIAEEIEKRTNGNVKLEIYWSGAMGKPKELLGLVSDGTIDMTSIPAGFYNASFPLWLAPNSIPFVMETTQEAWRSATMLPNEVPGVQNEMHKLNLKCLYHQVLPPYQIFARQPIKTFEDLKGKKFCTWGEYLPRAFKSAGAVGVSIFPAERYESLQRGVVDGVIWPLSLGQLTRSHEVAPNVCLWNLGPIVGRGTYVNLDAWNKLPSDVQKILIEVSAEANEMQLKKWDRWDAEARKQLEEAGAVFHEIPASERQKWIAANPDFIGEWIENAEKKGLGKEARELKDKWFEIIAEY